MAHTHVGYKPHTGYAHCGRRSFGFRQHAPRAGRTHALTGGPTVYTALCGATVTADEHDEFGFRRERGPRNIHPAGTIPVTCRKCLRHI